MLSLLTEKPKTPAKPPSCHIAPGHSESQRVKVILFRQTAWTVKKARPFSARIKPQFAGRREHGMAMQYDHFPALLPGNEARFFVGNFRP
jgi:hypothetical protein